MAVSVRVDVFIALGSFDNDLKSASQRGQMVFMTSTPVRSFFRAVSTPTSQTAPHHAQEAVGRLLGWLSPLDIVARSACSMPRLLAQNGTSWRVETRRKWQNRLRN
jgi:hypothetical protein